MVYVKIAFGMFTAFVRGAASLSKIVKLSSFTMFTIVLIVSRSLKMKFTKIISGYVVQHFEGRVCTSQSFGATDSPEYERDGGPLRRCPVRPEVYYPFDMVQPDPE